VKVKSRRKPMRESVDIEVKETTSLQKKVASGILLGLSFALVAGYLTAGFLSTQIHPLTAPAQEQRSLPQYADGQVIVKLTPEAKGFASSLTDLAAGKQLSSDALSHPIVRLSQEQGLTSIERVFQDNRAPEEILAKYPARSARAPKDFVFPDLSAIYLLTFPETIEAPSLAAAFAETDGIEYAQLNYTISFSVRPIETPPQEPNPPGGGIPCPGPSYPCDPYFWSSGSWGQSYADLWGMKKIKADRAWPTAKGSGVLVAVNDSGIDYNHPDIGGRLWRNPDEIEGNGVDDDGNGYVDDSRGWDLFNNDNDPIDDYGHGTHVAGTIAATGNNGMGVIGVAPEARVMAVKVGNEYGVVTGGSAGITFAAHMGADVINNSWGGGCGLGCGEPEIRPGYNDPVTRDAIAEAVGLGAVVVFASGNDSRDILYDSIGSGTNPKPIIVAASDPSDRITIFSNRGDLIDVAAPGSDILSVKSAQCYRLVCPSTKLVGCSGTSPCYVRASGSSMAAPHVSGLAALILEEHPTWSHEQVRQALRASADDIEYPGIDYLAGAGRVNAERALSISSVPTVDITGPATPSFFDQDSNGTVTISGTASGASFSSYQLFFRSGSSSWAPIAPPATTPVTNGTLGHWQITDLWDGEYALLLAVTQTDGIVFSDVADGIILHQAEPVSITPAGKQRNPDISGTRVVWRDLRSGATGVYLKDLVAGNEQRIATVGYAPQISGDLVTWTDFEHAWLYDHANGTSRSIGTIANSMSNDVADPEVDGTTIVWVSGYPHQGTLCIYNRADGTCVVRWTTPGLSMSSDIAVSGNLVAWTKQVSGVWDIYYCLFDAASGVCPEQRLTELGTNEKHLAVSGSRIVWEDGGGVWLHDLATGAELAVDGYYSGSNPSISGATVTWENTFFDMLYYCHYDPIANTCPIQYATKDHRYSNLTPAVDGNRIVFTHYYDTTDTDQDIFLFEEPVGETQLSSGPAAQTAVSGGYAAWSIAGQPGIWLRNLETDTAVRLPVASLNAGFDLYGSRVAWIEYVGGRYDVFTCLYNPATGSCPVSRLTNDTDMPNTIRMSGDYVVWDEYAPGDPSRSWIDLYDLSEGSLQTIADGMGKRLYPDVAGNRIAWEQTEGRTDIYTCDYDRATHACPARRITTDAARPVAPRIFGNNVVWTDSRTAPNHDLYLYDLARNAERALVTGSSDPLYANVTENRIVWQDGADSFVYGCVYHSYTFACPATKLSGAAATRTWIDAAGNSAIWKDGSAGDRVVHRWW
jgi:beta propeller repeat protein